MKRFCAGLVPIVLIAAPASATPTPFAGIFEISHDGAGRVTQCEAVGIVDARTGNSKPQPMVFPKAFLDAACGYVQSHLKATAPGHYFTYFPFDPDNPTDLETDR